MAPTMTPPTTTTTMHTLILWALIYHHQLRTSLMGIIHRCWLHMPLTLMGIIHPHRPHMPPMLLEIIHLHHPRTRLMGIVHLVSVMGEIISLSGIHLHMQMRRNHWGRR